MKGYCFILNKSDTIRWKTSLVDVHQLVDDIVKYFLDCKVLLLLFSLILLFPNWQVISYLVSESLISVIILILQCSAHHLINRAT